MIKRTEHVLEELAKRRVDIYDECGAVIEWI